jgi:hypothetical protein
VDYQAMQVIVQVSFDSTQQDLLVALSKMEGLQRPVRRAEKQGLNEVQ